MHKNTKQLQTTYESSLSKLRDQYSNHRPMLVNHENSQEFSRLIKENKNLYNEINKLKNKLSEQQQKTKKMCFNLELQNKKLRIQFNRGIQQHKNNQNCLHKKITKYKQQIALLQERIAKEQKDDKVNKQNLQNDIRKLKGKVRSQQEQIQEKVKQLIETRRCIKQLQSLNANLQLTRLQCDKIKAQNRQLTHKLIKSNAQNSYQNKINAFDSQLQVKDEQLSECRAQAKQVKIQNQSLVYQIKILAFDNNKLLAENRRLFRMFQQWQIEKQLSARKNGSQAVNQWQDTQQYINRSNPNCWEKQNNQNQENYFQLILKNALRQKNQEINILKRRIQQKNDELLNQKQNNSDLLIEKQNLITQNKTLKELVARLEKKIDQKQLIQEKTPTKYSSVSQIRKNKCSNNDQEDTQVKNIKKKHNEEENIKSPQTLRGNSKWKSQYDKLKKDIKQIDSELQQQKRICVQKDKIMEKYQQEKQLLIKQIGKLKKKIYSQRQQTKTLISKLQLEKYEQMKRLNIQMIEMQQKMKKAYQIQTNSDSSSHGFKNGKRLPKIIIEQTQNENQTIKRDENSRKQLYNIQVRSPKGQKMEQLQYYPIKQLKHSQVSMSIDSVTQTPMIRKRTQMGPNNARFQQSKVIVSMESPMATSQKQIVPTFGNKQQLNKLYQNIEMKICESNFQCKKQPLQRQFAQKSNQNTGKSDPLPTKQKLAVQKPNYFKSQKNYLQDYSQINIHEKKSFKLTQSNIFGLE